MKILIFINKNTHKEKVFWKNFDFIQKKSFLGTFCTKKAQKQTAKKGTSTKKGIPGVYYSIQFFVEILKMNGKKKTGGVISFSLVFFKIAK